MQERRYAHYLSVLGACMDSDRDIIQDFVEVWIWYI